jgi:mannose-6-phosphate isomerase-like protein (cupin superfamily)
VVLNLKGKTEILSDNFINLLVLEGEAEIEYDSDKISIKKGDSVYIPCGVKCSISGNAQIIKSTK